MGLGHGAGGQELMGSAGALEKPQEKPGSEQLPRAARKACPPGSRPQWGQVGGTRSLPGCLELLSIMGHLREVPHGPHPESARGTLAIDARTRVGARNLSE